MEEKGRDEDLEIPFLIFNFFFNFRKTFSNFPKYFSRFLKNFLEIIEKLFWIKIFH